MSRCAPPNGATPTSAAPAAPLCWLRSWLRYKLAKTLAQRVGATTIGRAHAVRSVLQNGGPARPHLHTNACGDFTLLSRDTWFTLRGYPEWEMYSFHIEHGSGWTPEQSRQLKERMETLGISMLDYADYVERVERTRVDPDSDLWSGTDSGLASFNLPEPRVGAET